MKEELLDSVSVLALATVVPAPSPNTQTFVRFGLFNAYVISWRRLLRFAQSKCLAKVVYMAKIPVSSTGMTHQQAGQ